MEENKFNYEYDAVKQKDIKNIVNKYKPKTEEEDKYERMKRLDASVTSKATARSIAVGVIGALILGVGMCCCLEWNQMIIGVIIGIVGIIFAARAYPTYIKTLKEEGAKVSAEILELAKELGENN